MARTGRRPGPSRTREKILAAARAHFAREGYERATIRAIARSARVDPKLVQHFFGSKDRLFNAAMRLPIDPGAVIPSVLAPGPDGLGVRLVRTFVGIWDSREGRHFVGLLRSVVSRDEAASLMREFFTHAIFGPVSRLLDVDVPRRRASLAATQLVGLALVRYVVRLEPVASADPDDLARWIGPAIQRYFTADLDANAPRP